MSQGMLIHWVVEGVEGDWTQGYRSVLASNRYRAILPAQGLRELGHRVELINARNWQPALATGGTKPDVVVIGKLLPGADATHYRQASRRLLEHTHNARELGSAVVADINDDHFQHPVLGEHWRAIVNAAQGVTAGSEEMAATVRRYTLNPVSVIADPVAAPLRQARVYQAATGPARWLRGMANNLGYLNTRLHCVWFGNPTNWPAMADWAKRLVPFARRHSLHIEVISAPGMGIEDFIERYNEQNRPHALMEFTPWEEHTVWDHVADADAVLIPSDIEDGKKRVKTANRVIDALSSGRFVIASPVPAYQAYADHVWLGDDPAVALDWMLAHPDEAQAKIERGQQAVTESVGTMAIARQWQSALSEFEARAATRDILDRVAPPVAEAKGDLARIDEVKLNLGCGDKILPGYVNVDVAPTRAGKKPDVLCDLHRLEPFQDDTADEILAVHVIEHFWRWEVADILKEWVRVLKPGGKLILECPNLISACQEFLKNPELGARPDQRGQRTMWVFYGDPAWHDPLMVHRWGYTPESLAGLLREVGLVDVGQEAAQFKMREPRDMRVTGWKPI